MGRAVTGAKPWTLTLENEQFALTRTVGVAPTSTVESLRGEVGVLGGLTRRRGLLWSSVRVDIAGGTRLVLGGIPNAAAASLERQVKAAIAGVELRKRAEQRKRQQQQEEAERKRRLQELEHQLDDEIRKIQEWTATVAVAINREFRRRGWLSRDFRDAQAALKPSGLERLLGKPDVGAMVKARPADAHAAIKFWRADLPGVMEARNKEHLAREKEASEHFFDHVEKSELTDEQTDAVVCFDNRVLLVAAAGSGKTSTMVAKAGYALHKGYFEPEAMLLLAFNSKAAEELKERIVTRLEPLGLPAQRVAANTFHAFGLTVIGEATGRKPSVASWVGDAGKEAEAILEMVDDLKGTDLKFRTQWDIFRLVFGQALPKFGEEAVDPDSWDADHDRDGFKTLNNEVVKSRGEQLIANWLFYNGVKYEYETPYQVDTATAQRRQYEPDFYFPDVDVYLEHWALNDKGEPPAKFEGYRESMAWKKELHRLHGTRLLETTTAQLWSGRAFSYLERELAALGLKLDPNPDRPVPGQPPMESKRLASIIRAFMTHSKGAGIGAGELRRRLADSSAGHFRFRHGVFLDIFEKVSARWEARLRAERVIDFDDMLVQAAEFIEQGRWESPYELVMVDEFQDVSRARARLIAALVSKPGRHLFGVGDDWQGINRFTGADLSVMTNFQEVFGVGVALKLETTFRCPQSLCDISSGFVQKNPKQMPKNVRSKKADLPGSVRVVSIYDDRQIRAGVEAVLGRLAAEQDWRGRPVSVYLLGRYNRDKEYLPRTCDSRFKVSFVTAHSSKGLEADHVIIPRVTSELLGFPSGMSDDPVLQLVLPGGEDFAFAEERRLFYVALTRARKTTTVLTVARRESPFVMELVKDFGLKVTDVTGEESASEVCPCMKGFFVPRSSKYGAFYGCSTYPRCKNKRKVAVGQSI